MSIYEYYYGRKLQSMNFSPILRMASGRVARAQPRRGMQTLEAAVPDVIKTLQVQHKRLSSRFRAMSESHIVSKSVKSSGMMIIPTESVVLDAATRSEVRWLHHTYGLEEVQEGRRGKVLLQAPEGGEKGIKTAFEAARASFERGNVGAAHPNFLRALQRPAPSTSVAPVVWNLNNPGNPGVPGADVHALAAWTITKGDPDVRVAVLDEGVDTLHSKLRHAVVDEADFVDDHVHARPYGDDAHGTACAGIVVSRDADVAGLASQVSLVAVRIAKSDASGFWIFDDFDTADAIDWSWDEAKADVLSNSWGGGPEVDVITRAIERARTQGRRGRGAVVVFAAGNDQAPVDYPGSLPNILAVGASNQWDERKTTNSKDGEDWWGSNYGDSLDVLAPGVKIATTDIRGRRGYSRTLLTRTFNGTSAATPHVAAAAALILSVAPRLREDQVREIINSTADPLSHGGGWNKYQGHGRLNTYAALRLARRT